MSKKLYEESYMEDIANMIRSKTHRTSGIHVDNFATEIDKIPPKVYRINNPYTPMAVGKSNLDNAYKAVITAISYWNAKNSGSEDFEYSDGDGCLKGSTSAELHDSSGNAIMDCSTYIGLVLRGISYINSPYYTSAETTIDPRTVIAVDESWVESYFDLQEVRHTDSLNFPVYSYTTNEGKYRVLTASDMAHYYYNLGLFWYVDEEKFEPRVGDICFFYKELEDETGRIMLKYPRRLLGISHVGIMIDPTSYLNITDYETSGDLIRTSIGSRQPFAYARPYYGALTDGVADELTVNKVDLIPDALAGIKQGSSTTSGVTFSVTGKSITLSGTSTDGMSKDIIDESCPLYLPAGTYKLSGFVNESGTNTVSATHSMWGFRVYDASTGDGISGTTTSSNGENTATRTPVWDVGAGAVFTLSEPTYIYINLWLPGSKDCSTLSGYPVLYRIS